MQQISIAGAAIAVLVVAAGAASAQEPRERSVSPWFIYRGEESIEAIRSHSHAISSISALGGFDERFVEQCHELGIEVLILVGGEEEELATPEGRKQLIDSWVSRCEKLGADGIDVDYEALPEGFGEPTRALLRDASEALHAAGLRLSICVAYELCTWQIPADPRPGEVQIRNWYDPATIAETCDVVRVMCYDMHSLSSKSIGPVSTRPWARDAMGFWMRYVPVEKLVMGLPTYSRDLTMTMQRPADSVYGPMPDVSDGTEMQRQWLPYEEINQYRYVDDDGLLPLFFASDADSTRAHFITAGELGIPTIGFWHYGAITQEQWSVVNEWLGGDAGADG